jgi:hypothetical protein
MTKRQALKNLDDMIRRAVENKASPEYAFNLLWKARGWIEGVLDEMRGKG